MRRPRWLCTVILALTMREIRALLCNVGDKAVYNGKETINQKTAPYECPAAADACIAYGYVFTVAGNQARAAIGECARSTVDTCDKKREDINDLIIELYPWIRPQYRELETDCRLCHENNCNEVAYPRGSARRSTLSLSVAAFALSISIYNLRVS